MQKIILATSNKNKVREIRDLLKALPLEVISKDEYGDLPEVVEDGMTFKENALKKAREICKATGLIALADDSGLEVDGLNGGPGVYSARFAGEDAADQNNNALLLKKLSNLPDEERGAQFRCVIAMVFPDGRELTADEYCRGEILHEPRGENGFGYDPLFYFPALKKTFAELGREEKGKVSHRGKALVKIRSGLIRENP